VALDKDREDFVRAFAMAVASWIALAEPALAATPNAAITATLNAYIDSLGRGDAKAAAAVLAGDVSIVDEVPPYAWRGPGAFEAMGAALAAYDKKAGITDAGVTLSPPTRIEAAGDRAYVVAPAVFRFKQGGVDMRELGRMTFTLSDGAGGWKITGWTWTGPKATPVKP
jgi:ketosteroid isomerase-like protein